MKRLLCSGLTALVISLLLLAASLSYAQATEKKKVLILNSYHIGYKWTDNIVKAIEHVLSDKSISLYIEYMDTKRILDERYFQQLHEIYKLKYDRVKFDVIISSDDDAFNFLRKYRDDIFPDTPVVFCGVNWFKESDLNGHKLFTGVNETPDLRAGFETILKLQPDTKRIVIINDTTTTGLKIHTELLRIIPDFQNAVKFVLLEDIEMTKLQK
jgi:sigma-B regulation protein RsbU (phosphoserine phosphatase)